MTTGDMFFEHESAKMRVPSGVCSNCGEAAHEDHADMCCTCMAICFGEFDHRGEHIDANRVGTREYARKVAFLASRHG